MNEKMNLTEAKLSVDDIDDIVMLANNYITTELESAGWGRLSPPKLGRGEARAFIRAMNEVVVKKSKQDG